jgi:hypothetical protein
MCQAGLKTILQVEKQTFQNYQDYLWPYVRACK